MRDSWSHQKAEEGEKKERDECHLPETKGGESFKQNGMKKTVKCSREMELDDDLRACIGFDIEVAFVI